MLVTHPALNRAMWVAEQLGLLPTLLSSSPASSDELFESWSKWFRELSILASRIALKEECNTENVISMYLMFLVITKRCFRKRLHPLDINQILLEPYEDLCKSFSYSDTPLLITEGQVEWPGSLITLIVKSSVTASINLGFIAMDRFELRLISSYLRSSPNL